MRPRQRSAIASPPSRSCTLRKLGLDSAWIAQHHFHEARGRPAVAVHLPRLRRGANLAHPSRHRHRHPAAGECRCALPKMPPCSICSATAASSSASAPAAIRRPSPPSASTVPSATRSLPAILTWSARPGRRAAHRRRHALSATARNLDKRIWQATFSVAGGARAGKAGDGLLLSRTQPRPRRRRRPRSPRSRTRSSTPISRRCRRDASPRIMASRTRLRRRRPDEAMRLADIGLRRALRAVPQGRPRQAWRDAARR